MVLIRPEELKGMMDYREAIEVVEIAFREWGKSSVLNNPRQRTREGYAELFYVGNILRLLGQT